MEFVFVWVVVVEMHTFFGCRRKSLGFTVIIGIVAFVWVGDIDFMSERGISV